MQKIYLILLVSVMTLIGTMDAFSQYCVPIMGNSWGYISEAKSTGAVSNFTNVTGVSPRGVLQYQDYSTTHGLVTAPGATFTLSGKRSYAMMIYIDWNADGDFSDPGEEVHSETNTSSQERTFSKTITVPTTAAVGQMTRIRFFTGWNRYKNPCGFNNGNSRYGGEAEDYFLFVTFDNNAGITKIAKPQAECNGSAGTSVDVKFSNKGVKNLDTLFFAGEVRPQVGGRTSMPTKMWTGSLKTGEEVKTPFNVYNHTFNMKAGDTVCVWSFNPNNVPDSASADDTLCFVILKGMKGKFTVGDTTAGAHDFRTLKDAVDSINLAGAICDSVIIELHDTSWSTYRGQYQLKDIIGTSPTSPIIFRNEAHNMYQTRIWYDSLTEDYNHVFLLENTSDIFFEGINFSSTTGRSNGFGTNIKVKNSDRINLISCGFTNTQTSRNDADYNLVSANGVDGLNVMECTFMNGSSSIDVQASNNVSISKSNFSQMFVNGINIEGSDNVVVKRNTFSSTSFLTNGIAISLNTVNNSVEVSYNTIKVAKNQWPLYGIAMDNCNALNSSSEVYNNMVNLGQAWSSLLFHAIHLNDVVGTSVVFNSAAVSGNNASNAALYSNGGTRNTAFNNVFAAMIDGFCIHTPVAASIVSGNNNNLYSAGGNVGRLGTAPSSTLAAWQTATGLDANSVSVNPFFYSIKTSDLHVCNDKLFQAGSSISSITDDWDGDTRDPSKPCIGADEFAPVSQFSLGAPYGLCDGDSTNLVAGKGLTGEIAIWKDASGTVIDTAQTIKITTPGKYSVTLLNACGINADSTEIIAPIKVVLASDTNICPGFTVNVDATTTNGNSYVWSNGQTSNAITVTSQGTYLVTATDVWKCISSDSIVVTYSTPAQLTSGDTVVCQDAPFSVFGGISKTQPNVSYKWTGFDFDPGDVDNAFVDYDLMSKDTTIIVELTHRGCVTTDTMKVVRKPLPIVKNLTYSTNGLALFVGSNNSSGAFHNWKFGDSDTSVWGMPRHVYSKSGVYIVQYTNSNICGSADTSFEVTIVGLSLGEYNANSNLNVYPNPNNGNFNIELTDVTGNNVWINIVDAQGRTVYNKELGQVSGSALETISLNQTGSGLYLIQLNIDGKVQIARITIE
jgi:hypothetical protein